MKVIENVQHDISDASFSVETAIDLLHSLSEDAGECRDSDMLKAIVSDLVRVKQQLDNHAEQLATLQDRFDY